MLRATLTVADWAVHEARFHKAFSFMSKGHVSDQMKPLADYLRLGPAKREGISAFIHVPDERGRHMVAVVSPSLVAATEVRLQAWRKLNAVGEASAAPPKTAEAAPAASQPPAAAPTDLDAAMHQQLTERLLDLCGFTRDADFFKQSLRDFVAADPSKNGDDA